MRLWRILLYAYCILAESVVPCSKLSTVCFLSYDKPGSLVVWALHRTLSELVPEGIHRNLCFRRHKTISYGADRSTLTAAGDGTSMMPLKTNLSGQRSESRRRLRDVFYLKSIQSARVFHSCFLFLGARLILVTLISTLGPIHSRNPNPVPHCLHLNHRRIHTQPIHPTLRVHLA